MSKVPAVTYESHAVDPSLKAIKELGQAAPTTQFIRVQSLQSITLTSLGRAAGLPCPATLLVQKSGKSSKAQLLHCIEDLPRALRRLERLSGRRLRLEGKPSLQSEHLLAITPSVWLHVMWQTPDKFRVATFLPWYLCSHSRV